jgi:hypothetical protein
VLHRDGRGRQGHPPHSAAAGFYQALADESARLRRQLAHAIGAARHSP